MDASIWCDKSFRTTDGVDVQIIGLYYDKDDNPDNVITVSIRFDGETRIVFSVHRIGHETPSNEDILNKYTTKIQKIVRYVTSSSLDDLKTIHRVFR